MRTWLKPGWALLMIVLFAAGCSTSPQRSGDASPHYKVGKSYQVDGRWYHPKEEPGYSKVGTASWYGSKFHGRLTANGEIFDMNRLSAAHTTLPLPSMVEVTNLENGRKVTVRVNDRGPFVGDRIIDMSRQAARRLGFEEQGTARVRVRYIGRAPLMAEAPKDNRKKGHRKDRRERIRAATPVDEVTVVGGDEGVAASEATAGGATSISDLLTSIESAPALTPGAEQAAIAEACSPVAGPCEIPAADLSTPDPDDARLVDVAPSPETPPQALYIIRVAALSSLDNIEALREELGGIGPLRMSRVETDEGKVFYRVNLGPFSAIETAALRLEEVRKAGYADAALVTLTP